METGYKQVYATDSDGNGVVFTEYGGRRRRAGLGTSTRGGNRRFPGAWKGNPSNAWRSGLSSQADSPGVIHVLCGSGGSGGTPVPWGS